MVAKGKGKRKRKGKGERGKGKGKEKVKGRGEGKGKGKALMYINKEHPQERSTLNSDIKTNKIPPPANTEGLRR